MSERTATPVLDAAIVQLQGKLPRVAKTESANITRKDGTPGPKYKYADLADVSEAILSLLSECGLAFTAKGGFEGGVFGLVTSLVHKCGERDDGFWPLPDPRQTPPQQVGSAITYYRRYSLCAATGVAPDGDDDDAASAQSNFRPSAGDAFEAAAPARPRQQEGEKWKPRQAEQPAASGGTDGPQGEGLFVTKFHADLATAQDEAACRDLTSRAGAAIRSKAITAAVGNDLLADVRKRTAEIRDAA